VRHEQARHGPAIDARRLGLGSPQMAVDQIAERFGFAWIPPAGNG
jgi:hypothetical protein